MNYQKEFHTIVTTHIFLLSINHTQHTCSYLLRSMIIHLLCALTRRGCIDLDSRGTGSPMYPCDGLRSLFKHTLDRTCLPPHPKMCLSWCSGILISITHATIECTPRSVSLNWFKSAAEATLLVCATSFGSRRPIGYICACAVPPSNCRFNSC